MTGSQQSSEARLICLDFYPEDGWGDRLGERVGASRGCWRDPGWEMVGGRPGE